VRGVGSVVAVIPGSSSCRRERRSTGVIDAIPFRPANFPGL
jgi:hypothetical protein